MKPKTVNPKATNGGKGRFGLYSAGAACAAFLLALLVALWSGDVGQIAPSQPDHPGGAAEQPDPAPALLVSGQAPPLNSSREPAQEATKDESIPYGAEFWRPHPPKPQQSPAARGSRSSMHSTVSDVAGLDVAEVMERVSCAIARRNESDAPTLETRTYTATFQAHGLRFVAHPPAARAVAGAGGASDVSPLSAELRTVSARQGDREWLARETMPLHWRVVGNTAQTPLVSELNLLEHYETRRDGVELSWVIGRRPAGSGSVEIAMEVTGADFAGVSAGGHHFADRDGQPRIRFGPSVAVDKAGRTEDLITRWDGRHLRILVPERFLAQADYPVAVDPFIGVEFGMDEPVLVPSPWEQRQPAIAASGTDFLVVWSDGLQFFRSIVGTRVGSSGQILDPTGLRISSPGADDTLPAVASDGQDFFVVWQRDVDQFGSTIRFLRGSRVTAEGEVLEPDGIQLSFSSPPAGEPVIANAGGAYLVAWEGSYYVGSLSASKIVARGIRFSNGLPVLTNLEQLHSNSSWQKQPAISSNGREFFVIWAESPLTSSLTNNIYGVRVRYLRGRS